MLSKKSFIILYSHETLIEAAFFLGEKKFCALANWKEAGGHELCVCVCVRVGGVPQAALRYIPQCKHSCSTGLVGETPMNNIFLKQFNLLTPVVFPLPQKKKTTALKRLYHPSNISELGQQDETFIRSDTWAHCASTG